MVEPIQGEGGIRPADPSFLAGLRELCDQSGALLILDEVQCGLGRTGQMLAFQNYDIKPDIVTLAKALGGGFPIGALLATEQAATGFVPGDHASTFGGNPLACAVARRVLDLISAPGFLDQVMATSSYFIDKLEQLAAREQRAVQVRGRGLMLGIEFSSEVRGLVDRCLANGLLLINAGPRVLRFVPPLNITKSEIDEALKILEQSLEEWQS